MRDRLQEWVPRLVLAPSFVAILLFVYGFIIYTGWLSMTNSRMLPSNEFIGLANYEKLFGLRHWNIALKNLFIFGALYILISSFLGMLLAILLDQQIRNEGFIRTVYLYPMAISFVVTGVAWKWFLDPGIGLQNTMHQWGWESFEFTWIKDRTMAIYTIVIAAVWQSSGYVMAMFLAGLRGVDNEVIKAAQVDGASGFLIYRRIIIPMMRPVFLSAFVVLTHLAIKSYDLIVAMTGGGPGRATEVPATFMYSYTFTRNQMGVGASSAIIMLVMVFSIVIPYLYSEIRAGGDKR